MSLHLSFRVWSLLPTHCKYGGYFCSWSPPMTHSVGLLRTTERPVADISTWKHTAFTRQTFMPSVVFEPAIPASERRQIHTIDCTATAIGDCRVNQYKCHKGWHNLRAGIPESVCLPTVCQLQTLGLLNGSVQTLILLKLESYVCRKLRNRNRAPLMPLSYVHNPPTVSCSFHLHNLRGTPGDTS